jgi:nitroimidazol reductase NimA-like FMN-containing flavoprotein (pyridoxamine 5'-phosphate oxidase superfamily)
MALSRDLALTDAERDEILSSEWNMRISTVSPSGRINATPLWFAWHDGHVWAYCRGQKVENMRRTGQCTVLVDRAVRIPELQGVMMQGDVTVLEDADAEAAEPGLATVRQIMGRKYHGGHGGPERGEPTPMAASARGRHWRWVKITPTHVVTWDNTKIKR